MITVALLGNPNVGKTTLFNALTDSKEYVGNWAGVTVEKKQGFLNADIKIVDLPGIYAMDTFSNEEKVSKEFLQTGEIDVIVNIVDASNLNRNLYLTFQLKEFKKPILFVLNMSDVAEKKGFKIDYEALEKNLMVKLIPITASKGIGVDKVKAILESKDFSWGVDETNYKFKNEEEAYMFIDDLIFKSVTTDNKKVSKSFTNTIDNIILNPWLTYPLFIAIMFFIFKITFGWIGTPLSDLLDELINERFSSYVEGALATSTPWFNSLIIEAIIGGVGAVIVFVPIIFTLFFCISILEDSGYMARVAFIMDGLMRKIGLSGKAFIPFIIGFGCSVPAVMAARTLESEKDRKMAALLAPIMSCNARLPVYITMVAVFFKDKGDLVIASLYILGIIIAFIVGLIFKNTIFRKEEEPFIIELPDIKSITKLTWDKGKEFLKKAGTIIFAMSVLVWILAKFNTTGYVEDVSQSFLSNIGGVIAPLFVPLGFGTWETAVAILTGLVAKESVVSTMGVIYGGNLTDILPNHFTMLSAYSFMVFVLLYTPCMGVIAAMKKEYGTKFALFSITYQLILAWVVSFLVFTIGKITFF